MATSDSYEEVNMAKLMEDGLDIEEEEDEQVDPDCEGFFESVAGLAKKAVKFMFDVNVSVKLETAFPLTEMRSHKRGGTVDAPKSITSKHTLEATGGLSIESGVSYLVGGKAGKKCRVVVVWQVYPNVKFTSANTVAVGFIELKTDIGKVFELIRVNEAAIKSGKSLEGNGVLELDVVRYERNVDVRAARCDNGIVSVAALLKDMKDGKVVIELEINRSGSD